MRDNRHFSKSKLLVGFLSFLIAVITPVAVFSDFFVKESHADSVETGPSYSLNEALPDVSTTGLRVILNQSAITETSQSFKISFASDVAGAYVNPSLGEARKYPEVVGVYIAVDDDSYPRDIRMADLPYYDVEPFPTDGTDNEKEAWRQKYQKTDSNGNYLYEPDGSPTLQDNHYYASERPIYNAYVHRIETVSGQKEIVIPRYIQYGSRWIFRVNYIGEDVFNSANAKTLEEKQSIYKDLETIVIGDNIRTVSESSIINTLDNLQIKFVSSESEITFPEGLWTDCKHVSFNYTPTAHELDIFDGSLKPDTEDPSNPIREKAHVFASAAPRSFSSPYTFVVGYISEDPSKSKPLILEYSFVGENKKNFAEFELLNGAKYGADVVGQDAGAYTLDKNIEFRVDKEHSLAKIDFDSLVLHNIFEMKNRVDPEHEPIEPDLDKEYIAKVKIGDVQEVQLNDVLDVKFKSVGQVLGYGRVDLVFTPNIESYKIFKPSTYSNYERRIESGEYEIRFLIRSLRSSYYIFTLKDNSTIKVSLSSCTQTNIPVDYVILNTKKTNDFQYMFVLSLVAPNFKLEDVKRIEVQGLSVSMDICATKTGTSQIVGKSDVTFRFGYTDILPEDESHNIFNGDAFILIMVFSFIGAFILITLAYFFYCKNKYKNDEFRRVDNKKFFKKAGIGLIGSGIVFTALTFLILRFSLFNNSFAMHNALDPYVIGFGVVALICIGYFIKFVVVMIRQEKERRKRIKLKIDEDEQLDGTK